MEREQEHQSLLLSGMICAGLLILADFLFYDEPPGWTCGLYLLVLAASLYISRGCPKLSNPLRAVFILLFGSAISLVIEPGVIPVLLAFLAVIVLDITLRYGWSSDVDKWKNRLSHFLTRRSPLFVLALRDFTAAFRLPRMKSEACAGWGYPILFSCGFLLLFQQANPIIEEYIISAVSSVLLGIGNLYDELRLFRVAFWVLFGSFLWALLGLCPNVDSSSAVAPAKKRLKESPSVQQAVRYLLVFNLVFAGQTLLDMRILWFGWQLPYGITYAQYAHRGAYPLLCAALLAGAFVFVFFRPNSEVEKKEITRTLVFVWIGQIVLLLFSALLRLNLYVEAYGLTRLRVAAWIWMLLLAVGFFLIAVRIWQYRSNQWLLVSNLSTLLLVAYLSSFVSTDRYIAEYNVENCLEISGSGVALDMNYLWHLGYQAVPAFDRLSVEAPKKIMRERARRYARIRRQELSGVLANWRGWTLRRWGLLASLNGSEGK